MVGNGKRGGLGIGVALLAAMASGCTFTLDDLQPWQVKGLYKILRQFRMNGAITREYTPNNDNDDVIKTTFAVSTCPKVSDTWGSAWECQGSVSGIFRIKG